MRNGKLYVTVSQSGGDLSCARPRAVLYVIHVEDDFDLALQNLQSSPASDISLSTLNDSPESPKVSLLCTKAARHSSLFNFLISRCLSATPSSRIRRVRIICIPPIFSTTTCTNECCRRIIVWIISFFCEWLRSAPAHPRALLPQVFFHKVAPFRFVFHSISYIKMQYFVPIRIRRAE
jgi:hypothetical protein